MPRNTFVYAMCGDAHVVTVNQSLRFLKTFSRSDIVVVRSRATAEVDHDQVIDGIVPPGLDDRQASIYLKTTLATYVGGPCCYLDSDVVAVSESVDDVFQHRAGPVTFAQDHVGIDVFSRHAVNCGCAKSPCRHLRDRLQDTFGVCVDRGNWRHWNGGVFLFNEDAIPFMRLWHDLSMLVFEDPAWKTRDQGALIAAVWLSGLQEQPTLPRKFNWIVDPFYGIPSVDRATLKPSKYAVHDDYVLPSIDRNRRPSDREACLLHFVNQGIGKTGWANWDRVEAYFEAVTMNDRHDR